MLSRNASVALCFFFILMQFNLSGQDKRTDSLYTYGTASPGGIGKFYYGREIAGMIDAAGANWLDRSSRQRQEKTDLAVGSMRLKKDDVVADIGAGTGYYSFKIARYLPEGKVYAVEVQNDFIEIIRSRVRDSALSNIEVVKGSEQTPNLPENTFNYVLMVDVYHELEYPHEMLAAIKKILKPGGKLILMEYKAEDPAVKIRPLHKTSEKQIRMELEANGFRMIENGTFLPIQHFFVFETDTDKN